MITMLALAVVYQLGLYAPGADPQTAKPVTVITLPNASCVHEGDVHLNVIPFVKTPTLVDFQVGHMICTADLRTVLKIVVGPVHVAVREAGGPWHAAVNQIGIPPAEPVNAEPQIFVRVRE